MKPQTAVFRRHFSRAPLPHTSCYIVLQSCNLQRMCVPGAGTRVLGLTRDRKEATSIPANMNTKQAKHGQGISKRSMQCIAISCILHIWPPVQSKVKDISPSEKTGEPFLIFFGAPVKSCDFNGSSSFVDVETVIEPYWTSRSHEPKRVSYLETPISTPDKIRIKRAYKTDQNSKKFRKKLHKSSSPQPWTANPSSEVLTPLCSPDKTRNKLNFKLQQTSQTGRNRLHACSCQFCHSSYCSCWLQAGQSRVYELPGRGANGCHCWLVFKDWPSQVEDKLDCEGWLNLTFQLYMEIVFCCILNCNMSCFVFDAGKYGSTCAGSPSSPRTKFLEFGQDNGTLGHEPHEKLELQWHTALSFISESRPTNKNKSHKMQSATFQEVKHIHTYIYWYTCQCIRTRRPISPVSESFCTSAHLGTHGLGKLQVFRHSFQHSVPWHWCAWCHNSRTWRFLSIFFPLFFFLLSLSLTFVTCFLLLLATACDTFDLFWHLLNSKCARVPQKAAPAIEVLSKNARRVEEKFASITDFRSKRCTSQKMQQYTTVNSALPKLQGMCVCSR